MNGRETAEALRAEERERTIHLIDQVAIQRALLGEPMALTELERGAAIVLCDLNGLSREITAEALGLNVRQLEREIKYRRRDLPAARADYLATAARQPALDLIDAVDAWDRDAIAAILDGTDRQGLYALVVLLAAFAGRVRDPRRPGLDEAGEPR